MCITSSRALLDNSYIGAWDIELPKLGYRHVLAYQNRVKNSSEGPNCMLLHIPSKKNIEPEWLIDSSNHPTFLTDLYSHIDPVDTSEMWMSPSSEPNNYVIEQGVYHIAILNNLDENSIADTLKLIPKRKLPLIKSELIHFFRKNFPDFPLLLCCFDNKEAQFAAPILVHFPPRFPDTLMFNTIDAHGSVPNVDQKIDFHQKIIFGTYKKQSKKDSVYIKMIPDELVSFITESPLAAYSPNYIAAIDFKDRRAVPNKDVCVNLTDIHNMDLPQIKFALLGNRSTEIDVETRQLTNALLDIRL
jgi:hypothetical protein